MMASVSMLGCRKPAATPSTRVNFSMSRLPRLGQKLPEIGDDALDGACRNGCRTCQMRPTLRALSTLEVAVRAGDAALAGRHEIIVDRHAHRAARLAPLEAGF